MGAGSGHASPAIGPALVTGAGLCQCLIDARLDVAFRLTADGSEFGDHQIAGPLEHSLLAKRKRFDMAEIVKMFEHLGHFKDIAGAHLVRKIFETIFPVVSRRGKVSTKGLEQRLALDGRDRATQSNLRRVGNGNQYQGIGCGKSKRVEGQRYGADLLLLDLFDCTDTVIGVNNFLADLEAHLFHLRLVLRAPGKSHVARLMDKNVLRD